jgi:NADPH:quinone reductase-like Zn-dependent oxidoreductase
MYLRSAGVGLSTHVLVYGASGSVGTAAVHLAKHMAARVTAVGNTKNLELVRSSAPTTCLTTPGATTSRRTAGHTTSS